MYSLKPFYKGIESENQGVYAVVMFYPSGTYRIYIGCAYGTRGLRNQLEKEHQNHEHRVSEKYKSKYLYKLLEDKEITPYYVCLAKFDELVDAPVLVITEAIIASIMGSYSLKAYKEIRHPLLPPVDWNCGVNQSDPLVTEDSKEFNHDSTLLKRKRTLENALAGGSVHVSVLTDSRKTKYFFKVYELEFTIPPKYGRDGDLAASPTVEVRYDINDGPHPHKFSRKCTDQHEGCRLGIEVSKIVNGIKRTAWLERTVETGIRQANSLFDWLQGRIEDPDTYDWPADRVPFFGSLSLIRPNGKITKKVEENQKRVAENLGKKRKREESPEY